VPRKTSVDSASEGSQKPKKKAVRKKKVELASPVEEEIVPIPPEEQTSVDQVDNFEVHPKLSAAEAENESEKAEAEAMSAGELLESTKSSDSKSVSGPQGSMADIKPKNGSSRDFYPFSDSDSDRDFLAPEKFSFDLKPDESQMPEQRSKSRWLRTMTYILIAVIVIGGAALWFLNSYSKKLLNQSVFTTTPSTNNSNSGSNSNVGGPTASSIPKLALVNASDLIKNAIASAAAKNSQALQLDTQSNPTLPTATADTLYIKSASSSQTQAITDFLKQFGLTPQIQQKSDLADDYALYLASTLSNLNLGGLTSAVYNSGSTPGIAAKYCTALKKYKVASCNALNATAKQDGFTVATNSQTVLVNLSRTAEFKTAGFIPAASGQVEDIRVTASK